MSRQYSEGLKGILRDYSLLPEYSSMPIPTINTKSLFGDYPINIAATRGEIEEISLLLNSGADIDSRGEHGYTPLHNAVEQGHLGAVIFLVERGANFARVNDDGDSPLDLAKLLVEAEIQCYLEKLKSI